MIACYRSQIPDLFGDREGLRRFVAAHAGERVWSLTTMGLRSRIG
jgi:hypothetical protein